MPELITVEEFQIAGYLQELNRRFLHPLGLALAVERGDGPARISGIWDYRGDPEGMIFEPAELDTDDARDKQRRVSQEWSQHQAARQNGLGYTIQPIPGACDDAYIDPHLMLRFSGGHGEISGGGRRPDGPPPASPEGTA